MQRSVDRLLNNMVRVLSHHPCPDMETRQEKALSYGSRVENAAGELIFNKREMAGVQVFYAMLEKQLLASLAAEFPGNGAGRQ